MGMSSCYKWSDHSIFLSPAIEYNMESSWKRTSVVYEQCAACLDSRSIAAHWKQYYLVDISHIISKHHRIHLFSLITWVLILATTNHAALKKLSQLPLNRQSWPLPVVFFTSQIGYFHWTWNLQLFQRLLNGYTYLPKSGICSIKATNCGLGTTLPTE